MRNLKHLEILGVDGPDLTSEGINEGICCESRPLLFKLHLPLTPLTYEDLDLLLNSTPNLEHFCTAEENSSKIEVRKFIFIIL